MFQSLHAFGEWLSSTALSGVIRDVFWVIPTIQTVHILAIAAALSSFVMLGLHVVGIGLKDLPTDVVARRFLPWIWGALIVLLLSGSLLIVAEPGRSLENSVFQTKMLLLLIVFCAMLLFHRSVRRHESFWKSTSAGRAGAWVTVSVMLGLWASIVFAGRWIAYAE